MLLAALFVLALAIVVGCSIHERAWHEPKHPAKCDCMACGRRAVKRELRRAR